MKDSIEFIRFNPVSQPELLPQVVSCYQDVFADPPWNEWKVCSKCGKYWGSLAKLELEACKYMHCDRPLVDFWPAKKVGKDILHEVRGEASCWLALDSDKIVGFCWGYPIEISELSDKLKLKALHDVLNRLYPRMFIFAYQDEIGVLSEYRCRGIAKKLFHLRKTDFNFKGLSVGLVRTMTNPPTVTFQWYQRIGYSVIAAYGDIEGRVIMARPGYANDPGMETGFH